MTRLIASLRRAGLGWGILALVVAVAATWPVAARLTGFERLADHTLDDHVYYWNCWWVYRALLVLHINPLFCPEIFLPTGASIVVSPLAMPYALASIPWQAWLGSLRGGVITVHLIALLSFPLAVHGVWLLLRRLTVPSHIAFLAGCCYAFVPFRLLNMPRAHYLAGCLTAYFLWALLRAFEQRRWRPALLAGCVFAVAGACDAALMLEFGFAAGILLLPRLITATRQRSLQQAWPPVFATVRAFVFGIILLAPLLIPFALEVSKNPGTDVGQRLEFQSRPQRHQLILSPDLNNLGYYMSPALHEWWVDPDSALGHGTKWVRGTYQSFRPAGAWPGFEAVVAAAVAAFVLAFAGRGLRDRRAWCFAVLAVLGGLLALGPYRSLGDGSVRMPYYYLAKVTPGMQAGRYPAAHLRLLHLGIAIVAAYGVARSRALWSGAGFVLLGAAVVCWLQRPMLLEPVTAEPVYLRLAADPRPGVVLDLPPDMETPRRKMAIGHVTHQRPIMNGPLTRVPPAAWHFHDTEPLVPRLLDPPTRFDTPEVRAEAADNMRILREYEIRFIVVRRVIGNRDRDAFQRVIQYLAIHEGLTVEPTPNGHVLATVEDL